MYQDDSFFTLSLAGQIGLVMLSLILSAALLWFCWRLSRRSRWVTRCLIGLGSYIVFSWISPQVFYTYYLMIFDGLPTQWVIHWPPDLTTAVEEFTFTGSSSLAAHGRGILGWVCVLLPLVLGRFEPPVKHH